MNEAVSEQMMMQLFTKAHTHHFWQDKPVSDELLHTLYESMKWGPTCLNATPIRILFLKSKESKEKLVPSLLGSNVGQVVSAPVTAIIAQDMEFYEKLPILFPAFDARSSFLNNIPYIETTALRNSSLQGGYFILAARALGLDVGPMSGFKNETVDSLFFKDSSWRSNFLCNLGYGDSSKLYPRGPRVDFAEAVKIL